MIKIKKTKWHSNCINCQKSYKERTIYTIELQDLHINLCKECMIKFAMEMNGFLQKRKDE